MRRILADVVGQPGALPLLEYLLLELWQRRRGSFLTLEAYEAAGGVGGALANRANEVYGGLDAGQRDVARRVLLRLTQPGEGTDDTRRRAEIAELSVTADDGPAVAHVVESLSGARLLTLTADEATGAPAVEIAHEALIREWPELRGWIEEDREQLRLHRRLTEATDEWLGSGRDEALLYRGSRLAAWQERGTQDLNARESEFLAESRGLVERERVSRRRRLRVAFGALTVGIVALAALAAVALVARDQSRDDAAAAKAEAARSLAAQSRLALGTSGDGFTLAQRSIAESPTADGDEALRQAAQKPLRRSIATGHSRLWAIAPTARWPGRERQRGRPAPDLEPLPSGDPRRVGGHRPPVDLRADPAAGRTACSAATTTASSSSGICSTRARPWHRSRRNTIPSTAPRSSATAGSPPAARGGGSRCAIRPASVRPSSRSRPVTLPSARSSRCPEGASSPAARTASCRSGTPPGPGRASRP